MYKENKTKERNLKRKKIRPSTFLAARNIEINKIIAYTNLIVLSMLSSL